MADNNHNFFITKPMANNEFISQALKESNITTSENGAKKYSTSNNDFVDNFASISHYKSPRSFEDIAKDMTLLWSQNPLLCLKLAVYIRLITRKSKLSSNKVLEVQRGTGLKNEGIMRMLWIAYNYPEVFEYNIMLFIAAGSWKDVFTMLSYDLRNGWENRKLDWGLFYLIICNGLFDQNTTHLVRKYLPTIKTDRKCTTATTKADTLIGRWLARILFKGYKKETAYKLYRQYKSKGVAHQWQQLISKQLYNKIDFDNIAGRALSLLVNSKFLENHNLTDKYSEWIKEKPVAKYTGFVHELFANLNIYTEEHVKDTINAQFNKLVQVGKVNNNSSLLVVRDTSGSMTGRAIGCRVSSNCIAKAMALYFSEFLTGEFANTFAEFSSECKLHKWKGNTPVDKFLNDRCEAYGDTNFQSVIDLLIRIKNKGVPEKDFPSGILCLSDGELNKCGDITNFQLAIRRLSEAGFSKEYVNNFKIILWDIPNNFYGNNPEVKFEDFADTPNFFYLSGYDPSIIAFLIEGKTPSTAEELFLAAMDQSLLNMLKIV